jgi:hypothetical protein
VIHGLVPSRPRIVPAVRLGEWRNKWAIKGSYVRPANRKETFLRECQDVGIWRSSGLSSYGAAKVGTELVREPGLDWVLGVLGAAR